MVAFALLHPQAVPILASEIDHATSFFSLITSPIISFYLFGCSEHDGARREAEGS